MKAVIFGIEETADVIDYYFTHDSDIEIAAFTVDGDYIHQDQHNGRPLVPFENIEKEFPPEQYLACLLYTSPSPRDQRGSRMPSSA